MTAPLPTVDSPRAPTGDGPQRQGPRWWMLAVAVAGVLALVAGLALILSGGDAPEEPVAPVDEVVEPTPDIRYAEEPPANWDVTGVAAGAALEVRTGPGADLPVTATLAHDTVELESTGRIAYVDGVLWREIKVPGATTGWVEARFLTEHAPADPEVRYGEEPPANWDVTGVATGDVLNVRTGPGIEHPVTATLPPTTVELESTGRIAYVDGVLWREIKVPGATSGWVHGRYLTEHRPPEGIDEIGVGLPAPAMTTAREIFVQARRGDLAALAGLALDGDTEFTATFGEQVTTVPQLVALWEQIGRDEVLRAMLALVQLPEWYETAANDAAGQPVAIFVTPRFMHEPTAANRTALEQRLGAAQVEASIADGQWLGWRLGITAEGDWQFFVTGD